MKKKQSALACPCGSGKPYADCCRPCHEGEWAPDAVTLMRSRYSAYFFALEPYLRATWHPDTRPAEDNALLEGPSIRWIGLEIRSHAITGDDAAEVEFVARYRLGGRACRLHEHSRFVRENGRWFYLEGRHED